MAYEVKEYEVNYEDKRFQDVKNAEAKELSDLETTLANMKTETDTHYQGLKDAVESEKNEALKNQQAQTDFAIEKINQQKEQAHKDYIKEQAGAYGDWQKQSNQYGVNAEKMASQGLRNSGYSESSQVSMYNTYQNRVAMARQAFELAKLNYDNNIQEAKLQNNVALAEIRAKALQQQLELSLQGFQYKNQLVLDFADRKTAVKNRYYDQWKDVLAQINTENALAENQRQFAASYDLEQAKFDYQKEQDAAAMAAIDRSYLSSGNGSIKEAVAPGGTIHGGQYDGVKGLSYTNDNTDNLPINKTSLQAVQKKLGLAGAPSADVINNLVKKGIVSEYVKNGEIHLKVNDSKLGVGAMGLFTSTSNEKQKAYDALKAALYTPRASTNNRNIGGRKF